MKIAIRSIFVVGLLAVGFLLGRLTAERSEIVAPSDIAHAEENPPDRPGEPRTGTTPERSRDRATAPETAPIAPREAPATVLPRSTPFQPTPAVDVGRPTNGAGRANDSQPLADGLALGCDKEPTLRSTSGGARAALNFVNDRSAPVTVYWLDSAGERKAFRTLAPGEAFTQSTFVGHAWLVADPSDRCLDVYLPQLQTTQLTVSKHFVLRCTERYRSIEAKVPTEIEVTNDLATPVEIHWLDYEGSKQSRGTVRSGQVFKQRTFVGHPWLVTGEDGNCIGVYVPML